MEGVLENISGWAQEVFLVDSCSADATVDIALKYGVHVVQRRFRGFGDQWNFAMEALPITAPWTMKLDPDERLSLSLKKSIETLVLEKNVSGIIVNRRLWFMGKVLTINQAILRIWKTGTRSFYERSCKRTSNCFGRNKNCKWFFGTSRQPKSRSLANQTK